MATTKTKAKDNVFTDAERAAVAETARERKSQGKLTPEAERAAGEAEVLAKIAEMPEDDRRIAQRIHELVAANAPAFVPRTYYGMPAYALNGKTICFFKPAAKFKDRYATFGFETVARIDDGDMWPVAFAVIELTPKVEARIGELVKKAAG